MAPAGRIDTHNHVVPPRYAAWLKKKGIAAGGPPIPDWSLDAAISLMDKFRIQTSIMSISKPGVHLGDSSKVRKKAREVNEYAAEVVRKHPSRFGFFATLCLPNVKGSMEELAYAFDKLHADGVVLLANSHGIYLTARRSSIRPSTNSTNAMRWCSYIVTLVRLEPLKGMPAFVAAFLLDTTRAAMRLDGSGTLDRCPNLKTIVSHAGGFVPFASYRIAGAGSPKPDFADGGTVEEILL